MTDALSPALQGRAVVLLSHRGPVAFRRREGKRVATRGAGGLVTALSGLAEHLDDAVWVCAAAGEEDAAVAAEAGGAVTVAMGAEPHLVDAATDEPCMDLRLVEVERDRHEQFYGVIANPLLWFLQHSLYGLATEPDLTLRERRAFDDGYAYVNEQFAATVVEEVRRRGGDAVVMLHDYHFYLVGALVRAAFPDVVLSHFIHIPWPGPDAWRLLPPRSREQVLNGLLGNDVVAFHTERSARNFLLCCQEILDLPIDLDAMAVQVGGRQVHARFYPISIDVTALEQLAASEPVRRHAQLLRRQTGDGALVLRVDRTDPSKNIVRGFRAFDVLLGDHPELVGRVHFLALLQPSRQDVPEYADYIARIGGVVAEVNARHGRDDWVPIDLRLINDLELAVGAYQACDVLVVNAVADGMNLVAKEAVVVSEHDLVLALSENTGAHEELGAYAVTLHPFDVQQQADALHEALTMSADQRCSRRQAAADVVRHNDVGRWLRAQLDDLAPTLS